MVYISAGGTISTADPGVASMSMSVPLEIYSGGNDGMDAAGLYRLDAVRTVVSFIATNQASVKINLYNRDAAGGRSRVRDGLVAEAIDAPLPRLTQFRFLEKLALDMLLHDRWAFFIDFDGTRLRFRRLPARRVSFVMGGLDEITHVRVINEQGRRVDLPAESCVWDVGYDADGNTKQTVGSPPAPSLSTLTKELTRGAKYREQVWQNGIRVPMYVHRPIGAPSWKPDTRDRFIESLGNYTSRGGNSGGAPMMEDGMELRAAPTMAPADAQWAEGRKMTVVEVANFFHVPPELLGIREGTNSNVQAYREQLYREVLGPRIIATEQALNVGLAEWTGRGDYVEANLAVKLRASFEERAKMLQSSVGAPWMTRNEARTLDNRPAVDGGDELVTPLNVVVGSLASPRDTAPKAVVRSKSDNTSGRGGIATAEVEREALLRDLVTFSQAQADELRPLLLAKALPAIQAVFDVDAWSDRLTPRLYARMLRAAAAGSFDVLERLGISEYDQSVMQPWLAKAAESNARTMVQARYDALANALATGDGWETSVGQVLDSIETATKWGAAFGTEAVAFGGRDTAKKTGLTHKTWVTTSKDPRSSHAALNGQTIPIEYAFDNGLLAPGGPGPPDEVANCRCNLTFSKE